MKHIAILFVAAALTIGTAADAHHRDGHCRPGKNDATCPVPAPPPPAPAPSPTPPPPPPPSPSPTVDLRSYGAKCDARTDDTAAIRAGLADARSKGVTLLVPDGQCNFSDVIRVDSVRIAGNGPTSVLYATNYQRAALFLFGARPEVAYLKLTGNAAPGRQAAWESTKITVFGASDWLVEGVHIDRAPAASIQTAQGPVRGTIRNNVITNSLSDSIHLTARANGVLVEGNRIENSGDDGIAVVSYRGDGATVSNVQARNNVVRNQRWGRNMSVLGGTNILYENNLLESNPQWACLYLSQEDNWNTFAISGATARRNTLRNCGSTATGHSAVLMYADSGVNSDILVQQNDIYQDNRNGFNWWGPQQRITLDRNRYTGSGGAYVGSGPGVTVIPWDGSPVGYVAP